MFLIGRTTVLRFVMVTACVLLLFPAGMPAAIAQEPRPIAAPLATAKPVKRAVDTTWGTPAGQMVDRLLLQRLTQFQTLARGPWPEDINWTVILEKVHSGILAAPEDSLVSADAGSVELSPYRMPLATAIPLRSVKDVVEEMIAGLPPKGREAWLRVVSERASAEYAEALEVGDWATINRIASQDVHTPAGYKAILRIGNRHLDQGRTSAALRQFHRLLRSESARRTREPFLSLRTAAAWSLLGRDGQARIVLRDLTTWLKQHPAITKSVMNGAVPEVSEIAEWLRGNLSPAVSDTADVNPAGHYFSAGLLSSASAAAFSPDSQVAWKSDTSGFHVSITEKDRAKFLPLPEEEDENGFINSVDDDPYPETEAETAALVEAGMLHMLRRDHRQGLITLPACEPVVVAGQAVFRTLNSIRSVDLETGELQWESYVKDPAFAEQFDLRQARDSAMRIPRNNNDIDNPLNKRQSAVVYNRSHIDRSTGTFSTDGSLLFALEDAGVTATATSSVQSGLKAAVARKWNRLCCFDLQTGMVKWEIGGPQGDHELSAAGTFFLGVPTFFRGSAYVLGEQSSSVRLFCVEPSTGKIKWTQTITAVSTPVTREGLRRIGGISPCVVDGLIVCPNVCGIVVAFDPEQKRLAWVSRYRTRVVPQALIHRFSVGPAQVSMKQVDSVERWRCNATLDASGRVLLASLDSSELICLDAITGIRLWTRPREHGLYLGAVINDRVIVVGESDVRALSLSDGSVIWKVGLNRRVPSGRGIRIGTLFHLPISDVHSNGVTDSTPGGSDGGERDGGERADGFNTSPFAPQGNVITIDLKSGRLLAVSKTPDGLPLGNLVALDGRLVTQRFDSVVALEPLPAVEHRLVQRLRLQPGDTVALESRARIRLHEGKLEEGLDDLRLAIQSESTESAVSLLVAQVLEQLRHGQELTDNTKQTLASARLDARQQNAIDAVRTARLMETQEFIAAFDILLGTPQVDSTTGATFTVHGEPLSQSSRAWVATQLQSAYVSLRLQPDGFTGLAVLDQTIRQRLDEAKAESDPAALRNWMSLFSWHHLSAEAAATLVKRLDDQKEYLEIESLWAVLAEHPDDAIASVAKRQLVKPAPRVQRPVSDPKVTVTTDGVVSGRGDRIDVGGKRSPAIEGWGFELTRGKYLTAFDSTGTRRWTLTAEDLGTAPLLSVGRHSSTRIFSSGHLLAVSTGAEFSVFDIQGPSPRRLWKRALVDANEHGYLTVRRTHLLGSDILFSERMPVGSLDFLNSHCLVYRTGSTLRVVDATTGEPLWSRDRCDQSAFVFGGEHVLAVVSLGANHCQLFNLRTGTLIAEHFNIPLNMPLNTVLAAVKADVIIRQNRDVVHRFSRFDLRTGEAIWQHEVPGTVQVNVCNRKCQAELHQNGKIVIRDQVTGKNVFELQSQHGALPCTFFLHETTDSYILFTVPVPTAQTNYRSVKELNNHQVRVQGPAYGIDRHTGKLLWTVELELQFFTVEQPRDLPFIVLGCQAKRQGQSRDRTDVSIRVLDSRTGKTLYVAVDKDSLVRNIYSAGDSQTASITYGETVVHLDYSHSKQNSNPQQD